MRGPITLVLVSLALACGDRASDDGPAPTAEAPRIAAPTVSHAWSEHRSERCGFAVSLPGAPSAQPIPPGLLDQLAYEDPLQPLTMLASCGDVPRAGSPREFLDVTSAIIADQLHAQIDTRTKAELQGRPGLELTMTIPEAKKPPAIPWKGDLAYRLHLYVASTRQYQLHVLHPASTTLDDSVSRFVAGFRLLDSAPAAVEPPTWSTHSVQGVSIEAAGNPAPLRSADTGLLEGLRFEGPAGGPSPFTVSVWTAALPGNFDDPTARLRAHFMLRVATEHVEVVEESPTTVAGRPALDVTYRPNLPLPDDIAAGDAKTRAMVQAMIERDPSEFRVQLVLDGDHIVQLMAADPEPEDEAERFFASLRWPT